jgi:hypothetical protein
MKKLIRSIVFYVLSGYLLFGCAGQDEERNYGKNTILPGKQEVYKQKEGDRISGHDTVIHDLKYLKSQFQKRKAAFFELHQSDESNNVHASLVKLFIDRKPLEGGFIGSINKINKREDCADFRLIGLIRFVYQFWDTPLVRMSLQDSIRQAILNFKYWPDEPGIDNMCTWSENHHILFSTCEYLAGHYYRNEVFSNSGHSGSEKYERGKSRVARWLDLRYKTGFSEWLSNVYYIEDIAPLVALVDFSPDADIRMKATMVLDLILLDMALNNYQGTFGSTHGRSYFSSKISGKREGTRSIYKLLFDLNRFDIGNMATSALAISTMYKIPAVLYEIANDNSYHHMINMQRMGLKIEEIENYGLDCNRLEDGMTFLSFEAYCHPKTINLTMEMFDEYNWWENKFFRPFAKQKGLLNFLRNTHLLPVAARIFNKDLNRNTRTEVNIYTYKTPDYMLSSAQDYKKGYGGDQQAIWSAVLDQEAIVFTTHPVGYTKETPDYWTGSGNLPRVGQHENVAIILYKISTAPGLYVTHDLTYTHAWFPREEFDAVMQKGNWTFAAKGNAYIGLWSQNPVKWQEDGEYADREVIADGKKNIWLCEMGNSDAYRSFDQFVKRISDAVIETKELEILYNSPSQGTLQFGWHEPLTKDGKEVILKDYPRYLNHYTNTSFPAGNVIIQRGDYSLNLNYDTNERSASGFLN